MVSAFEDESVMRHPRTCSAEPDFGPMRSPSTLVHPKRRKNRSAAGASSIAARAHCSGVRDLASSTAMA
ncbi:hypothetical protein ACQEVS_06430 [Streptomyces sp. CA-181903]|uniref:hypothetical protein n=1 Tax=Streptomyces sp. CA-181903 TaxID=3240055 RepID=UPI003D8A4C56